MRIPFTNIEAHFGPARVQPDEDEKITTRPTSQGDVTIGIETGASGTQFFSGFIDGDEFVARLKGVQGRKTFDRMYRSDPVISATMHSLLLPLQGTTWEMVGGTDRGKQLVAKNILPTWRRHLRQVLLHLVHGFALFERVYEIQGNEVVEVKAAQRLATSIERWHTENRKLDEVEQFAQTDDDGGAEHVRIPATRLTLFVNEQEGDNFEGKSVLRPTFKPWFIKDATEKIMAIQTERFGLGVPIGTFPKGAAAQDQTTFREGLEALRSHENAFFMLPEGFTFEFAAYPRSGIDFVKRIQHLDSQIAVALFANFLLLGTGGRGGSRALASSAIDFALLANQHVAEYVEEVTFEDRIVPLGELNGIPRKELPRIRAGTLREMDPNKVGKTIVGLVGAGIITSDEELEKSLRRKLRLPEKKTQSTGADLGEKDLEERHGIATEAEEFFVDYEEIVRTLDGGKDKLERKLEAIRAKAVLRAKQFLRGPISSQNLTSIRSLDLRRFFRKETEEAILKDTISLKTDGKATVDRELRLQAKKDGRPFDLVRKRGKGERIFTMQTGIGALAMTDEAVNEFLEIRAAEQAEFMIGNLESAIKIEALNTARGLETVERFEESLETIGKGTVARTAAFSVANAFTLGRAIEAFSRTPEIETAWYSAILDGGTCEVCRPLHRTKHEPGDPAFRTPNPNCLGSLQCRCITVYKLR